MMDVQLDDLIHSARQATYEHDGTAAVLWRKIAEDHPDDLSLIKEAASTLVTLKAARDAESILRPALTRFPADLDLLMDFARCAVQLGDVEEEIARWAVMRARFPTHLPGFIGGMRAARKLGRLAEAERLATEALAQHPDHPRLLVESAICADVRSDWSEAILRWRQVDQLGAMDGRGYFGLGIALIRSGQVDEGEALLWKGLSKYPKDLDIRVGLAEAATAREHWGAAVSIWNDLLKEHPNTQRFVDGLGMATWRYNVHLETGGEQLDADEVRVAEVDLVLDNAMRKFMLCFESMGEDCEFGLVQRRYGAEPLSMLRWCSTHTGTVTLGLRRQFQGVGEVENVEVDLGKPEIMVNEKSSGIRFHTFIQRSPSLDLDHFARRQAKHLVYLKRMFLERLRDGSKVFVYKVIKPEPAAILETIYDEIQKYAPSPLLVVQRADPGNPPGSLRRIKGDLFFGYIAGFGLDNGPVWKISFESWVDLCKGVMTSLGREVPG